MGYSENSQAKHERVYAALSDIFTPGEEVEVEGVKVKLVIINRTFRCFDIIGTEFVGSSRLSQYEAAEYITTRPNTRNT